MFVMSSWGVAWSVMPSKEGINVNAVSIASEVDYDLPLKSSVIVMDTSYCVDSAMQQSHWFHDVQVIHL